MFLAEEPAENQGRGERGEGAIKLEVYFPFVDQDASA